MSHLMNKPNSLVAGDDQVLQTVQRTFGDRLRKLGESIGVTVAAPAAEQAAAVAKREAGAAVQQHGATGLLVLAGFAVLVGLVAARMVRG